MQVWWPTSDVYGCDWPILGLSTRNTLEPRIESKASSCLGHVAIIKESSIVSNLLL